MGSEVCDGIKQIQIQIQRKIKIQLQYKKYKRGKACICCGKQSLWWLHTNTNTNGDGNTIAIHEILERKSFYTCAVRSKVCDGFIQIQIQRQIKIQLQYKKYSRGKASMCCGKQSLWWLHAVLILLPPHFHKSPSIANFIKHTQASSASTKKSNLPLGADIPNQFCKCLQFLCPSQKPQQISKSLKLEKYSTHT